MHAELHSLPHPASSILQLVGPVLCSPAKPLPQDLDAFLAHGIAAGHEAVYVSMGSAFRLNAEELHAMAEALSNMPNPVLWKLPSADLPGLLMPLATCVYIPAGVWCVCLPAFRLFMCLSG